MTQGRVFLGAELEGEVLGGKESFRILPPLSEKGSHPGIPMPT